jgi:hypothetical protein
MKRPKKVDRAAQQDHARHADPRCERSPDLIDNQPVEGHTELTQRVVVRQPFGAHEEQGTIGTVIASRPAQCTRVPATEPQRSSHVAATVPEDDAAAPCAGLARGGSLTLFLNDLRRIALVMAIVVGTLLPHVAAAQSADDPAAVDDMPALIDDTGPANDAGNVEAPAPPIEQTSDAPALRGLPSYRANATYLGRLQDIRSAWWNVEYQINDMARQQRLGALNPYVSVRAGMYRYPAAADQLDRVLATITPPPPRFQHVHDLHLAASNEFHQAVDAAAWWLSSGDEGGLKNARTHFDQMDGLLAQALTELG